MNIFFQAEDGIRDLVRSRGLGDVYKRQQVTEAIEPLRREKQVRSSLEAEITMNDLNAILQLSLIHI